VAQIGEEKEVSRMSDYASFMDAAGKVGQAIDRGEEDLAAVLSRCAVLIAAAVLVAGGKLAAPSTADSVAKMVEALGSKPINFLEGR
jgi:hypothetical protein